MEKKRNLWKHTVKVDGDPEDHQKRRWLMMIEGFPQKNMVTLRVTNHIFWTQGLKSGDNSTLPASTQVRVESRLRLISYQEAGRQNNMPSHATAIWRKNKTCCPLTPNHSQQQQ